MHRRAHLGLRLFAVTVCALLATVCRPAEKLFNDATIFPALAGQGQFELRAVEPRVQKVVVNFFAPDCPPCEKEIPALKQFYSAHAGDKELLFVSIGSSLKAVGSGGITKAPTDAEIRAELAQFAKRFALDYPQFVAGTTELAAWRVTGFPETFIFVRDRNAWKLKRKFISEITRENLENELK